MTNKREKMLNIKFKNFKNKNPNTINFFLILECQKLKRPITPSVDKEMDKPELS